MDKKWLTDAWRAYAEMIWGSRLSKKEQKVDTTWSIKHEGKLNPNNIIFSDNKYREMVEKLKKVDESLGKGAKDERHG